MMVTLRVMLGRPYHVEDSSSLMAIMMNDYTEGRAKQNTSPSTQRTDCSLKAMKTYDNAESRAGHKEDYWEATDGNTEGCTQ